MAEIKDIAPEGALLSDEELKLVVGGSDCPQPRSWARTYSEGGCWTWDLTGNDSPILAYY